MWKIVNLDGTTLVAYEDELEVISKKVLDF